MSENWKKYMRISVAEKQEIIQLVDRSELGVNKTLQQLDIAKSTFYNWYKAYLEQGSQGLDIKKQTRRQWNSIPEEQKQLVVEVALWITRSFRQGSWPAG